MKIDWFIVILLIIALIALIFFLAKKNKRNRRNLVKKLNRDYKKRDEDESETNDEV